MTLTDQDWRPRLAAMVDQIAAGRHLTSPEWRESFTDVPRHLFVPTVWTIDTAGSAALSGDDPAQRAAGWIWSTSTRRW